MFQNIKMSSNRLVKEDNVYYFYSKSLNFFVFVAIVLQKNTQNLAFLHFKLKL